MDNLDKLIEDLKKLLDKKIIEQYYIITNFLNKKVPYEEVLSNYVCFLNKNNIELLFDQADDKFDSTTSHLIELINKNQQKIKNKIIFSIVLYDNNYIKTTKNNPCLKNDVHTLYLITTRENAQKLIFLGSFEN